ncbi:class I SAM-dependent methyltransferase [Arthrobacter sp. CG_A4]|uniref:class I SAM-dependent methyltransferase n=1 Tax=Arthrobacter sp. CG_A4 TaxID=3071706 RepID=UPI002E00A714|nr:SAM-dependent methyltransferase [Arthrobacter sp. CG_A4]
MAPLQENQLAEFVALLKTEGRRSVLGLDCGPGADGLRFVRAGIHFTGVDPSEENIHSARARGLEATVAHAGSLPFADSAFPAVWAVGALAGLPPEQRDDVVRELGRVTAPGGPIAVVLPEEGLPEPDPHGQGLPEPGPGDEEDGGFTVLRSPA